MQPPKTEAAKVEQPPDVVPADALPPEAVAAATQSSRTVEIIVTWVVALIVFVIFGLGIGGMLMMSGGLGSAMPCGETATTCTGVDAKTAEYRRTLNQGSLIFFGAFFVCIGGAIARTVMLNKQSRNENFVIVAVPQPGQQVPEAPAQTKAQP